MGRWVGIMCFVRIITLDRDYTTSDLLFHPTLLQSDLDARKTVTIHVIDAQL